MLLRRRHITACFKGTLPIKQFYQGNIIVLLLKTQATVFQEFNATASNKINPR